MEAAAVDRVLYVDTDIFILLAGSGLLSHTAALFGFSEEQMRRLPALPHMLRESKKLKQAYPQPIRDKAAIAAEKIGGVTDRPSDDDVFGRLNGVTNIDGGEAALLATLVENDSHLLCSADLNCMRALGGAPDLQDIRSAIHGRLICLEAAVRKLVLHDGVGPTAQAFTELIPHNRQLQVFFSDANKANQAQCLKAVRSYFNDLVNNHNCSFLLWPES